MKFEQQKTPLVRIPALSENFGVPNMLIKDESKNRYGSWKDRRLQPIVEGVRRMKPDKVVLITAGNAAYSLARMLEGTPTKVAAIIDRNVSTRIKDKLRSVCFQVIETNLDARLEKEERIQLARLSKDEHIIDVTDSYSVGYESIVDEVASVNPAAIVVPVGQGEGFDGVCRGVLKHKLNTVVIGVMPLSQEDTIADKLQSHHTHHVRNIARSMMRLPRGQTQMCAVDESNIAKAYALASEEGSTNWEPSSAIVLPIRETLADLGLLHSGRDIIFINSGRGVV